MHEILFSKLANGREDKMDVYRQLLFRKMEKSSILEKFIRKLFSLSKPKVVHLRPLSSSLPFFKFCKQNLIYFNTNMGKLLFI